MKRSAILINTSRGPIVDEAALIAALRAEQIRGAGLDVYDIEPLPPEHPFRTLGNVVLTPHIGYVIDSAYKVMHETTVVNIQEWLADPAADKLTRELAPKNGMQTATPGLCL